MCLLEAGVVARGRPAGLSLRRQRGAPIIGAVTPPTFRSTVAALAAGQLVCWAALYYAFTSFVLPMQRGLGWSKPALMGAFTLGLAVWGAASYAVGAAIDRGRGVIR